MPARPAGPAAGTEVTADPDRSGRGSRLDAPSSPAGSRPASPVTWARCVLQDREIARLTFSARWPRVRAWR
jgi:hypothetical protein